MKTFTISRNDEVYECFPDLVLTPSGRLVLTYRESDGHVANQYSRLIVRTSDDTGATWSDRHVLIEGESSPVPRAMPYWNCPRVSVLPDGRIALVCDLFRSDMPAATQDEATHNSLWFSTDDGATWSDPEEIAPVGIVPDKLHSLASGGWLFGTHFPDPATGKLVQRCWLAAAPHARWEGPLTVAAGPDWNLCEGAFVEVKPGILVCYMRENTGKGWPAFKALSTDGGRTWQGPFPTLLPACHRPASGLTQAGELLTCARNMPGPAGTPAPLAFYAAIESAQSALTPTFEGQACRIRVIEDNGGDMGYSGWVEYAPGKFLAAYYTRKEAPKGFIRGVFFDAEDF